MKNLQKREYSSVTVKTIFYNCFLARWLLKNVGQETLLYPKCKGIIPGESWGLEKGKTAKLVVPLNWLTSKTRQKQRVKSLVDPAVWDQESNKYLST